MPSVTGHTRRKSKLVRRSRAADRLATAIGDRCQAITTAWNIPQDFDREVRQLEALILRAPVNPGLANETLARISPYQAIQLQRAYCRWETALETQHAQTVCQGTARDMGAYPLTSRFQGLLARELSLLPTPPRSVLFIGSGPFPVSSLMVHQLTGAEVACLDHSTEAVETSRQVIAHLCSTAPIRVLVGAGEKIEARGFDTIIVALLAKPKNRILANLRATMDPQCRLLCRTSTGLRTLLYEPPRVPFSAHFEVIDYQTADGDQTISTVLLRPRQVAVVRDLIPAR